MPLGDQPWVTAPGPQFPTHTLYIVENAITGTDSTTGLPQGTALIATPLFPPPRVLLEAKLIPGPGGEMVRMGDAQVSNLNRQAWPLARLLAARFFRLDNGATGDMYQLLKETLAESGPASWEFVLERT